MFREFITINAGTTTPTEIHNDIIMLRGSHVAHDCIIEDGTTLSVGAIILGHVHVMKESNCGSGCLIHQHQVIGSWSMIGMGCVVPKKTLVEPGKVWVGNPAKILRDNTHLTKNIPKGIMAYHKIRWSDAVSHHIPSEKK
jgi:UDP-N-acetylglucosamine acyltransferase